MMRRTKLLCLLLALMLLVGCAPAEKTPGTVPASELPPFALAAPVYPEAAPYPSQLAYGDDQEAADAAWEAWQAERDAQPRTAGIDSGYLSATLQQFLPGEAAENRAFSPLSLYLALGMLAELTDGESRAQILRLLGEEDLESLRETASQAWQAVYRDDGAVTSILGSSLWLNEEVTMEPEPLQRLAEVYYASTYRGNMTELSGAMQDWINEQTGGLLTELVKDLKLDEGIILALVSTIYYQAGWAVEFDRTEPDTFAAPAGEMTCDFMRGSCETDYRRGENYTAVPWQMANDGGTLWLILPDEGLSPEAWLAEGGAEVLAAPGAAGEAVSARVNLSLPKFDIQTKLDLIEGLKALGVLDVFVPGSPAFSEFLPNWETELPHVTRAEQGVRFIADEKGVEAAAYTYVEIKYGAEESAPPPEFDFTLDRPFLFCLTTEGGLPLFAGIVNAPTPAAQ